MTEVDPYQDRDRNEDRDSVAEAVRLLAEALRQRAERHPWGHLLAGRTEAVDLSLSLPLSLRNGQLDALALEVAAALDEGVRATLTHRAAFRPGRVFCLRCESADCAHAAPTDPRQVFTGYGSTGLPRFADLGQLLLERKDDRVDRLYAEPPRLVTLVVPGSELTAELLPAYHDQEGGYRIHGQVVAGWYRIPDPSGRPCSLAVSLQVASTQPAGSRRRFGLNVLGLGPGGEPLETLYDRLGAIPWADTVRWAQEALGSIERAAAGPRGRGKGAAEHRERRLAGLLEGIARRLEKTRRSRERRTRHAQRRHAERDRPTDMALRDLARAADGDVLLDTRRQTLVVLGERGRAHVFNDAGKLVTSIRYNPAAIDRRRQRGLWRPADKERVSALRQRVASRAAGEPSP